MINKNELLGDIMLKKINLLIPMVLIITCCLSACMGIGSMGGGADGHCSQYQFDSKKQTWVNAQDQPVVCTIVDGERIFNYIPGEGCNLWKQMYEADDSAVISDIIIQTGATAKKYCVLQRYFEIDNSGQVLILGGSYCFKQAGQGTYTFASCEGVQRKNPNNK